tara:strand:+ start:403 stop:693 length:291 start_codon:yes stop_codon:yes gene_type:complete
MERITFKTITDTEGTEPKDNAAGALSQGFSSGMEAAQNAEENGDEENQGQNNGSDSSPEVKSEGSWKDGKTFGETKIGKGLGNIGKFVKFWAKKGM